MNDIILAIDLDGVLVSEDSALEIYEEAYLDTLEDLRKMGIKIPEEYRVHSFENYCKIAKGEHGELFREIYRRNYLKTLEEHSDEIVESNRERAINVYNQAVSSYNPRDVFILTANPGGKSIVKKLIPEIEEDKIIVVDDTAYVENKSEELKKLNSLGRVIYIADRDDIDAEVARRAGVEYVNVNKFIASLNLMERDLYNL